MKTENAEKKGFLALADGLVFPGVPFGAAEDRLGEVVFNTSMAGYQEMLTDPSYAGQILVLTAPEIGSVGINAGDDQAARMACAGLLVRESNAPSNWRSCKTLDEALAENGVPALAGVATRALTRHLRDCGTQKGYLCVSGEVGETEAVERARAWEGLDGKDYAKEVSTQEAYDFSDAGAKRVAVLDFGVKRGILQQLAEAGARVRVFPASTGAAEVLAWEPDGVFLSNGPADPAGLPYAAETIRGLLGKKPVFGICLGHQLLGLALGGKTERLRFGHHGGNHPVEDVRTRRAWITSQNHNFVVREESLPDGVEVTHRSLFDRSVEGLESKELNAFSVQFHPEAAPGPRDARGLFASFLARL
ncbi:MAG: glutamine-hydrolyzing carbamoyl-phosphate synthase small subunit [Kiritimatiellae bacterium]|nr:glutamine-hydrolyzing carbamoyl-phosphate synthase small subunit [Kiritimatiellia bacterium]